MNGRALYREYAKSKGYDCKEFIRLENDWEGIQKFEYKNSMGYLRQINIQPVDMINWIIRRCKVELK